MNKQELTTEEMEVDLIEFSKSGPQDINDKLNEYEDTELDDDISEERERLQEEAVADYLENEYREDYADELAELQKEAVDEYRNSGQFYDEWSCELEPFRIKALYDKLQELCKEDGQ